MKKNFSISTDHKLKLVLLIQFLWISVLFFLSVWWGKLLLKQADRIAELEKISGLASLQTEQNWLRTYRMLYWESAFFFVLLVAFSGILFWIYWRDLKRTKALQAFFASLTHELRTPLASIRLQAESIADHLFTKDPNPYLERLVCRLLEDTTRFETQVERTLELSRLEGGGVIFSNPIELKEIIEKTFLGFPQNLKDKIKLNSKELSNISHSRALGDFSSVQVIFRNLFENSLKHGSTVEKETIHVDISMENKGPWILLKYRDSGIGFQGKEKKLGELFYKSEKSSGAGVGLYLVKTLMQKMGGKAEFKTNSNLLNTSGFEVELWFQQ